MNHRETILSQKTAPSPALSIGLANRLALPQQGIEKPQKPHGNDDFIPWFDADNAFPAHIAERTRLSTTHSRILNDKITYTVGDGLLYDTGSNKKEQSRLEKYCRRVNASGQSLEEVFRRIATDWWSFGNAFLELIDLGGGRVFLEHKDASCCRVARPGAGGEQAILYSRDWKNYRTEKWCKPVSVPLYPAFGPVKGLPGKRSILHLKKYAPGYFFYGQIDYYAAYYSGWLDIDYLIPRYNLTRFHNQFRGSGMLVVAGSQFSPEQAEAMKNELMRDLTGQDNNSKMLVAVVNDESLAPRWIPFDDAPDGAFAELQAVANDNIILAHRWHPALCVQQEGKLSNASDIRAAFDMVMNTVIKPEQNHLLAALAGVLRENCGFLSLRDITVSNSAPVSFSGSLDPIQVLTTDEQRAILGYGPADNDGLNITK